MGTKARALALVASIALLASVASPVEAASQSVGPGPITSGLAGKCVDDFGDNAADGAVVDLYDCNGGAAQQWTLPGDGTVRINGKCMDVTGAGTASGTLVELWDCNGGSNQMWSAQADGTLKSAQSGRCLDDPGSSTTNGTQLIIWDCNGGANQRWTPPTARVGTWSAGLEQNGPGFTNQSIRMVAHTTVAGSQVRVRLSNLYGTTAVSVGAVDLAVQSSNGSAVAGTHHAVTFAGSASSSIAAGADLVSDPVAMSVNADQDLLVSIYLPGTTGPSTWHQNANDTSYVSATGNHVGDDSTANYPSSSNSGSWFFLSGLDVVSPTATGTVVAIGDSITDGYQSSWGANHRWPDDLARRLNALAGGTPRGVVDAGISSNRVLTDADSTNPSLLKRFEHDALGQPGVKDIILLEGINDIGSNVGAGGGALTAQQLESAYQTVINEAHAEGVKIYGATILPYQESGYYTSSGESIREAVNQWIRTSGAFDGVIDMDAALRSSTNPLLLNPAYDSGDHLHPNDNGYQAMANAVNLNLLTQ
ncbi:MAG TPA: ricin-type beta-trefoil lectin domain protein [Actinospica sp.]|nr:ricin-type beta-trefoil lectin domain protein [Actinospica sp.]